jgi:hypothetical protein
MVICVPSERLCGKLVPLIVKNVPPKGFKSMDGVTLLIIRGTLIDKLLATGINPEES